MAIPVNASKMVYSPAQYQLAQFVDWRYRLGINKDAVTWLSVNLAC